MRGWSHLTKREKYLLLLGALVLVGAVLFQGVYDPLWREKRALSQELERYQTRLHEVKGLVTGEKELDEKIAALKQELALLERVAPPALNPAGLVRDIEAAARAAGVNILSFRFLPPTPSGELTRFPVDIVFAGKFGPVANFVDTLEKLPRPVLISSLALKPDAKGNLQAKLTAGFLVDERSKATAPAAPPTYGNRNPFEPVEKGH